jgi:hypothetical protein
MFFQKLLVLQQKGSFLFKKRSSFFSLLFLTTTVPCCAITLFSLFFLEGTQKSQLVLIGFACLLFCIGALKWIVSGLVVMVQREATSKIQKEHKEQESSAELTRQQEIACYREKMKEYETSFIEMQDAYDQKLKQQYKELEELQLEMARKVEDVRQAYFEFEDVRKEMGRLEEELKRIRSESEEKLSRKETLLSDYQRTIYEQRQVIEKKQHYVSKLETRIRELMYEVRTLLQLEEAPSDPNVDLHVHDAKSLIDYYMPTHTTKQQLNTFDLTMQLERFLEHAEKFTGADHLGYRGGSEPRFADLSHSGYQIDLRRFFDTLKEESSAIIFFFSLQEARFLFVNNYVKTVLGYSPEKFMYKFAEIVESGYQQWEEAVRKLREKSSSRVRLLMRTREGERLVFSCQMGMVSEGPFRGHIIGLLTPSN